MVITKPQKFLPQNVNNYLKVLVVLPLFFIKQDCVCYVRKSICLCVYGFRYRFETFFV